MFHFDFLKFEIKNRTFPDTDEVTLLQLSSCTKVPVVSYFYNHHTRALDDNSNQQQIIARPTTKENYFLPHFEMVNISMTDIEHSITDNCRSKYLNH